MRVSLSELAARLGGELVGSDEVATGFATDSGSVEAGSVFVAIRGARVDGHDFVSSALAAGAVGSIVERPVAGNYILVPSVVDAMAKMASSYRAEFSGPVIGITGSAGKTTTKEFLASALAPLGSVLKTVGNRNTEFTAPLLWADLDPEVKVVVVELAMRGFDQIAHLARFSRPTVGIITNIGYSHVETVGSREGIAKAKGELIEALPDDGTVILWSEDEYLGTLIAIAGDRPIKTFGYSGNADCHISGYRALDWHRSEVTGHLDGVAWTAIMPTVGRHLALNVAAAVLAASVVGVDPALAASQIENAKLPPMRMEISEYRGATLVLDNYNASPPAVIAALETLDEIPVSGRRIVVLGTMRELGEEAESGHREVGRALARSKVDLAVLYGPERFGPGVEWIQAAASLKGFAAGKIVRAETFDAVRDALVGLGSGDTVLVKGSRALELEKAFADSNSQ